MLVYISQGYPTLPFEQQKLTIEPDMQQTSWIVGLNIVNLNVAGELFVHVSLVHDEYLYVYTYILLIWINTLQTCIIVLFMCKLL